MRHSRFTKFLSLLLAVVMLIGVMPIAAFADDGIIPEGDGESTVNYTVKHYLEDEQAEDGYALDEEATETLSGNIGETTAAEAKTYDGYTAKEIQQVEITADGLAVVEIYYDKVVEQPATTANYTVKHYLQDEQAEGGYALDEETTETLSGNIGETTSAEAKTYDGYTAKEIQQVEITADGLAVVKIYYDKIVEQPAITADYTVKHYLQDEQAEGGYALDETATQTLSGNIGETTAAEAKTYDGYTAKEIQQVEITADGLAEVKIYYNLDKVEPETLSDEFVSETHDVFKTTTSTIAPGVTQSINYAYSKDGKQMVYYVATADITRDDVVMQTSYYKQHEGGALGMAKLTEQMAYAQTKYRNTEDELFISEYYTPVAGINASFYDMTTGQPMGVTYIDGVSFGSASYDNFFAILKDGTAVIDYRTNEGNYTGDKAIWQAVAGSEWLVRDGKDVTASATGSYNTDRHSRACVGITADGKVVMMVLDGRQEPFSCGGTMHELAQIMLEQKCVVAINLDGGGSATYVSRPEGESTVKVINRPSDGSERTISAGLIVASLTPSSDVFDRATLTAEEDYVTPGSTVNVSAVGVSPAGTPADIPDNAIWSTTLGTVENGVFTSDGTAGDAVVQMLVDGKVVGETTIHVCVPATLKFSLEKMFVSFGNAKELEIKALTADGLHEIAMKDGDIELSLSDEALGTVSGMTFTAAQEGTSVTTGTITAKFVGHDDVMTTMEVALTNLSDKPVVFEDFENDPEYKTGAHWMSDYITCEFEYVDKTTGKVHDGNKALAITLDGQSFGLNQYSGGARFGLDKTLNDKVSIVGAKKLGVWIYIPEDSAMMVPQIRFKKIDTSSSEEVQHRFYDTGYATTEAGHTGWQYFEIDMQNPNDAGQATSGIDLGDGTWYIYALEIYTISRADNPHNAEYGYDVNKLQSSHGPCTFYFDTFTVEYFDSGVDRQNPTFEYAKVSYAGMSDAVDLKGQTVTNNVVAFNAKAADASAFDAASAKAYVDGNLVNSTFDAATGMITTSDIKLADGVHTVKFEVADVYGNSNYVVRQLVVNANSGLPTARLINTNTVAHPLYNSLIWFNLEVDNIEKVDSVSMALNLNTTSKWELDHMDVAYGFESSYSVDKDTNTATITITKTGTPSLSGTAVLAKLPVRMGTYTASSKLYPMDMKLAMEKGLVTYSDSASMFSMANVDIDSEVYGWTSASTSSRHTAHTPGEPQDKDATCTESGYTGRTFCSACNSVVDWGTTIPATGHSYDFVDGVLQCTSCEKKFTGTWTDGKEYVDGKTTADGWVGESYYVGGEKLTGIQKVAAPDGSGEFYYDFGEDGVCAGKVKYTGLFFDGDVYRYSQLGELSSGWKLIDDEWYYFRQSTLAAATGRYHYDGDIWYVFENNGRLTSGVWLKDENGTRYYYGPSYYKTVGVANVLFAEIDGNVYGFDTNGYMYTGFNLLYGSNERQYTLYEFADDGVLIGKATTVYKDYYYEDGIKQTAYKLVKCNGSYYFISDGNKIAKDCTLYLKDSYLTGTPFTAGSYSFDAEGKMIIRNGPDGDYFYKDNVRQKAYQLVEFEGDYYFINDGNMLAKDCTLYLSERFVTGTPFTVGSYSFDADGKMIIKNGPVGDYFYVNSVKQKAYQLVEFEGNYYFINDGNKLAKNCTLYLSERFVTGTPFAVGSYSFDADGKLIIKNGPVGDYFYVNSVKQKAYQLVEYKGDYYFINDSNKLAKSCTLYLSERFVAGTSFAIGYYAFDADGKMII